MPLKYLNFLKKKNPPSKGKPDAVKIDEDRLFLEEHTDGIILMGMDGQIYDMNKKTSLLFGHSESLLPVSYENFVHKEDLAETRQRFEHAIQGRTEHYSCRVRHHDGRYIRTEITNIPIYRNHMIVGVYGILRDVSHIDNMRKLLSTLESTSKLAEETQGMVYLSFSDSGTLNKYSSSLSQLLGVDEPFKHLDSHSMIAKWIHPEDVKRLRDYIDAVKRNEQEFPAIEIRVKHAKFGYQETICKCAVLHATKNDEMTVTCVLYNVAESKKLRKELDVQQHRLDQLFSKSRNAIFTVNIETKQVEVFTKEYDVLFELPTAEMDHAYFNWERRIHPEDKPRVLSIYSQAAKGEEKELEYRYMTGNGKYKWIEERLVPQINTAGNKKLIQVIAGDITLVKDQQERIWDLAMLDALSGLPNRSLLLQTMEQWITEKTSFAIASVSFNEVSKVIETFGYEIGDKWIQTTATLLSDRLKPGMFLGHLYGDEYVLLLPDTSDEELIQQQLQFIKQLSRKKIAVDPYEWYPKITIGVSRYPADGQEPKELLRYANLALSRINHLIHGGVEMYSSTENIDSYRNFQLSKHLRNAVKQNELFLEYQPKVDAWSGEIVGAEALVRWQHPEWGKIPPGQFIPLSEENETHIEITDWVLEEVCRTLAQWKNEGKSIVPISINISPKRLMHGTFDEKMIRTIRQYGIAPEWLEIEILETDLLVDNIKIMDALTNIANHQIRISLDDFGSGYSSISYLHKFPIHTIKIDRQFSIRVDRDERTKSLIRSILFMAEEFGLQVVAEGVDQLGQLQSLRDMNCGIIQGFLFSRPVPLTLLEQHIRNKVISIQDTTSSENQDYGDALKAEVTISRFREQAVSIGRAPILISFANPREVTFISTMRLPIVDKIELSIYISKGQEETVIRVHPLSSIDLDNGLVKYVANFIQSRDAKNMRSLLTDHQGKINKGNAKST